LKAEHKRHQIRQLAYQDLKMSEKKFFSFLNKWVGTPALSSITELTTLDYIIRKLRQLKEMDQGRPAAVPLRQWRHLRQVQRRNAWTMALIRSVVFKETKVQRIRDLNQSTCAIVIHALHKMEDDAAAIDPNRNGGRQK